MSTYRPYVDTSSFHYPSELNQSSALPEDEGFNAYVHIDLEEIVAGKSRLSVVGLSVSRFYARMLVSQPFEVARFLLQVGEWDSAKQTTYDDYDFEQAESSSSDEEIDYFVDVRDTAASNETTTRKQFGNSQRRKFKPSKGRSVQLFTPNQNTPFNNTIQLESGPFIFSLMGSLSDKEGVFGLWRALNASCLCRAATGVVGAWATSFLASAFSIPDPQFVNLLHYSDPYTLVAISTAGCALAAALLTPLYMIRARLVATSLTAVDRPRSLRVSIIDTVSRGQIMAPWWVVLPTTLAATVHHAMLTAAPLILSNKVFGLDSFTAPKTYRIYELVTELLGLVVKMPLDTMASRAQLKACHASPRTLVIKPTEYNGILATLWSTFRGETPLPSLYRGWRSEVIGLLGEWGYNVLDEGKQLQQEHF